MTAPGLVCPSCDGPHMTDHPGGLLAIQHDPGCVLLPFEDATQAADHDRSHHGRFSRPSTPTERLILASMGLNAPIELSTVVEHVTPGVRRRNWATTPTTPNTTEEHQ